MDQSAKRVRIASKAVDATERLVRATRDLCELRDERAQSGNFTDEELAAASGLQHVDAYLIGALLDTVTPAIVQQVLLSEDNAPICLKVIR